MMLSQFLKQLKTTPNTIIFSDTFAVIEAYYNFTPTAFTNGALINAKGENSGSCKVFAFAMHQQLTAQEALYCFGEHYRAVLEDVGGASHQNIRNFIKTGFNGLSFKNDALKLKASN